MTLFGEGFLNFIKIYVGIANFKNVIYQNQMCLTLLQVGIYLILFLQLREGILITNINSVAKSPFNLIF